MGRTGDLGLRLEARKPLRRAAAGSKGRAMTNWVQGLYFVLQVCEGTEVHDARASAPGSQSLFVPSEVQQSWPPGG